MIHKYRIEKRIRVAYILYMDDIYVTHSNLIIINEENGQNMES